jgi:hypothetical protein
VADPDDVAASLVADLADDGEHVDDGYFTLDPAKAREKLRAYQLADPHEWILIAIAAGHVATAGAGPVQVSVGAATSVSFSGLSFTGEQLEHCFAAVFGREHDLEGTARTQAEVLRLLGIAGNAALSLPSTNVELESFERTGCHTLRVQADGALQLEHDTIPRGEIGVRVTVAGGRAQRADRERELVHERCRLATTAILLENQPIGRGLAAAFEQPLSPTKVRVGDVIIGEAAYERFGSDPARASFVNRSVLVETVIPRPRLDLAALETELDRGRWRKLVTRVTSALGLGGEDPAEER